MTTADWDTMLKALSNRQRRRLLVDLSKKNPQDYRLNVPEDVHDGGKNVEVLQAELTHQHLPHLEASGYIRWDQESHEIVKGPKFDEIRPLLDLILAHRDELPEGWI